MRAEHIGAQEFIGANDAAVNVRFGGEVDERVRVVGERREHLITISNVAMHEAMALGVEARQVVGVARVGERVEVYDLAVGARGERQSDESGADEARAAGHEKFKHG